MSLSTILKPEKSVNGHLSKWSAVHHPIEIQIQRQDAPVFVRTKSGASAPLKLKINTAVPTSLAVGQQIFYKSGTTSYTWTITSIVVVSPTSFWIHTNGTQTGTVYGGFVNYLGAYKNYYIETKVQVVNSSGAYETVGTIKTKTDTLGIAKINIQQLLRAKCTFENNFKYDVLNKGFIGEGGTFNLQHREGYNNTLLHYGTLLGLYYWINAAKQIQDIYGTNMGEYVPTYDNTRANRAKFQSVFARPTYFPGYPFSLNFIYSDNMLNYQLKRIEEQLDVNGNVVDNSNTAVNPTQRFKANRLMLEQGYASTVRRIRVWLETDGVIPVAEVDGSTYTIAGTTFSPFGTIQEVKPEK